METWGSFAYYFNVFASKSAMNPEHLSQAPEIIVFLLIGGGLSVLGSKLLAHTIDLHYTEPRQRGPEEELLSIQEREMKPRPQEQRSNSLTLPALLNLSAPRTLKGDVLCFVFLGYVLMAIMRFTMYWILQVHDTFTNDWKIDSDWGLLMLYLVGVLLAAFVPLRDLVWLQLLCVLLNVTQMFCRAFQREEPLEKEARMIWVLLPTFVQLLTNLLMIPTVMAGLNVSSALQNRVQLAAVGGAGALYVLIGLYMWITDHTVFSFAKQVITVVSVPCLYANIQIRLCVLSEIVVAWRYGQNLQVAKYDFPIRVKAVQILLPFVIYGLFKSVSLITSTELNIITKVQHGYMISGSLVLIIIAYCYQCTVQLKNRRNVHQVWMYVLYAGGFVSLAAAMACYWLYKPTEAAHSLLVDAMLFTFVLAWQVIGKFFN